MVAEAGVVATDDDQWGARITAFIVPSNNETIATEHLTASVIEQVANALGAESRPREVIVLTSLPTLPTGKIDREQLRALVANS